MKYLPPDFGNKKNKQHGETFNIYRLSISSYVVKAFVGIIGIFNLVLLVPDMMNLPSSASKVLAAGLRIFFTIMLALLYIRIKRIKSFEFLSLIVTFFELCAAVVFLIIFHLYISPDFTIQLLGVFIIIIIVFLIPNRWVYTVVVSIFLSAGFLISSYTKIAGLDSALFIASIVYLSIEIGLCAVFVYFFNRYQRGEYMAKTELRRVYATDPLTQIGNRVRLEDEAEKWIAFCKRHHLRLSLVVIDIDNMKQVNDQYGHPIGDEILCEMAQTMHTQLRKNDVCIRWGGDEFILLLPHTDVIEAKSLSERIRHEMLIHKFCVDMPITCSCGIAGMNDEYNLSQMIRQADAAMYIAKKQGKNNIEIYE